MQSTSFDPALERPRFRPLQAVPFQEAGAQYLALIDPSGILPEPVILAPDAILILLLQTADGEKTVPELAEIIREQTDFIVTPDKLRNVLVGLDKKGIMESTRIQELLNERMKAYRDQPTRKALLFQSQDKLAAIQFLRQEFARHTLMPDSPPAFLDLLGKGRLRALLTPHIDYRRGGSAYAWGYKALQQTSKPRTIIILGTLHVPSEEFFIATDKPFETALGTVQVDTELLREFEERFHGRLRHQEYLHAVETTIELQVTYLQHIYPDQDFRILPILVANCDFFLEEEGVYPDHDRDASTMIELLRETLANRPDVVLIGGVDLSHVGPEFGDDFLVTQEIEEEVRAQDYEMLDEIAALNPKGFFDHFRATLNSRRVCSVAPIYTLLRAVEGKATPHILAYRQANSEKMDCMVSFCSAAFFEKSLIIMP